MLKYIYYYKFIVILFNPDHVLVEFGFDWVAMVEYLIEKNDFVGEIKYIGTFQCRGDTVKYATYSEILTLYTSDDRDSSPT